MTLGSLRISFTYLGYTSISGTFMTGTLASILFMKLSTTTLAEKRIKIELEYHNRTNIMERNAAKLNK